MITADQLSARIEALPTLPEALSRLSELLLDAKATAFDFERVIRPDPALATNLLRAANSVFHRGLSAVTTAREAITRLGFARVYEVSTSIFLKRALPQVLPGYGFQATAFWRHCVAVAILSERLAKAVSLRKASLAYTAGLLHDTGKLVLGALLHEQMRAPPAGLEDVASEQVLLGTDHAEVGREVTLRWRFADEVANAARWHHPPGARPAALKPDLPLVVHVANGLAHCFGYAPDANPLRFDPGALKVLGLTLNETERIAADSTRAIENALSLGD
jgi:putative nucleotidyltransferase with HDIG domain